LYINVIGSRSQEQKGRKCPFMHLATPVGNFYLTRQMLPHTCTPVTICALSWVVDLRLEGSLVWLVFDSGRWT